jgi:transposase
LEANAALRSIVRRDTGEGYQEFLTRLAQESGIATPTREQLAKLDRKRARKGSNEDWVNPHDPEASITKMKDGRTHLAYKAEHAVDLETGAVVAVTVAAGDAGDTATILETLPQAGEHIAEVACATNNEEVGERVHPEGPVEAVGDKGYHSNDTLRALADAEVRTYISEPDRRSKSFPLVAHPTHSRCPAEPAHGLPRFGRFPDLLIETLPPLALTGRRFSLK